LVALLSFLSGCGSEDEEQQVQPDRTAPVLILLGDDPYQVPLNSTFDDPGASATDNVDGAVDVSITSNVDTSLPGSYTIEYSATDSSGNTATVTRTVVVVEALNIEVTSITSAPAFYVEIAYDKATSGKINQPIEFTAHTTNNTYDLTSYNWTFDDGDTESGEVISKTFTEPGVYEVALEVTDANANTVAVSVAINVFDDNNSSLNGLAGIYPGDIDGNELLESTDFTLLENHLSGVSSLQSDYQYLVADVNFDGDITDTDRTLLAAMLGENWPSYLSADEALPGSSLLIMHDALLDPLTSVEVQIGDDDPIALERVILGYGAFVVPINLDEFYFKNFTQKNTNIKLLSNNELIETFSFTILKPEPLTEPYTGLKEAVEQFDEALDLVNQELSAVLTQSTISEDSKTSIMRLMDVVSTDMLQYQSEMLEVLNAIDNDSLTYIEQLAKNNSRAINLDGLGHYSAPDAVNQFAKVRTSEASCSLPDRVDGLIRAVDTRVANEEIFKPTSDALGYSCDTLLLAATDPRYTVALAPIAFKCKAVSAAISSTLTVLEVITDTVPTLQPGLTFKSELETIEQYQQSGISTKLRVKNDVCASANQGTAKILDTVEEKLISLIMGKLIAGAAFDNIKALPLVKRKMFRADVIDTLRGFVSDALSPITDELTNQLNEFKSEFCGIVINSKVDYPTCNLEQFSIFNTLPAGSLDKEQEVYIGPSFIECFDLLGTDDDISIFGAFHSEQAEYSGSKDLLISCPALSGSVDISLRVTYNENTEYCQNERPVGSVETYTETWTFNPDNGTVNVSYGGESIVASYDSTTSSVSGNDNDSTGVWEWDATYAAEQSYQSQGAYTVFLGDGEDSIITDEGTCRWYWDMTARFNH